MNAARKNRSIVLNALCSLVDARLCGLAMTYPTHEVPMKIRELARHWEQNAKGRLTKTPYSIHLDVESAARLAALKEMYPKHHAEELLGELIGAALEELETSFPYIRGTKVIATDEEGDPMYEDVGPTPRFLSLSRRYLDELNQKDTDAEGAPAPLGTRQGGL